MTSMNLKYSDYSTKLNNGLHQLLESAHKADVTFAIEGQFIKAHQIILSMFSTYFQELFSANPCSHPIFFIKDVSYNMMKDILRFIYAGEVRMPEEDVPFFVDTANAFKVKGLTEIQKSTIFPEFDDHRTEDNMLSSKQLNDKHDTQIEDEANEESDESEEVAEEEGEEETFNVSKYLKYELDDSSMDIEESQIQFPVYQGSLVPDEHDFACIINEPERSLQKLPQRVHNEEGQEDEDNEDNEEDYVTVTFVKSKRGRSIIVDNYRYSEVSHKLKNIRRFRCSKKQSRKCAAEMYLTSDGYIFLRHQHEPICAMNQNSGEKDRVVNEQAYRKLPIQTNKKLIASKLAIKI